MLKKRIVANLIVKNGFVVQSIGFNKYLPIGSLAVSVEFLNQWGIDEIVISDISATPSGRIPQIGLYKNISKKCFVPLTIGGGVSSIEHIYQLLQSGADKVFINSYAVKNRQFISDCSKIFGNQCIIVACDVIYSEGKAMIFDYISKKPLNIDAIQYIKEVATCGAGEVLINCVDRDGKYTGYDIPLAKEIAQAIKIPVIFCGGVGKPIHFYDLLTETNVAAAAAGNYFHFSEHSVIVTKSYLLKKGLNIRLETLANYENNFISTNNRVEKKNDKELERLLYIKPIQEVI